MNRPGEAISADEEELSCYRLETMKRLFLFLNTRLEKSIEQWKTLQGENESSAKTETVVQLSAAISDGRRAVEEALQLMISLSPPGVPASPTTMGLSFKARFQGTPVSTLKNVAVSQNWIQNTLAPKDDPLRVSLGSGPAQQWRLRFPALEAAGEGKPPPPPATTPMLSSAAIASAFARFDADKSKMIDVAELGNALRELGINDPPAEIMQRYDGRGAAVGSGAITRTSSRPSCVSSPPPRPPRPRPSPPHS